MKKSRKSLVAALVLNVLTIFFAIGAISSFFYDGGQANMQNAGFKCLVYFTIDSNIVAAAACAVMCVYIVRGLKGKYDLPKWAFGFKFIGTTAVALTFLVVVLFLGPTQGFFLMFFGAGFNLHLVCPIMCMVSFIFLENEMTVSKKFALLGVVPSFIYGIVYVIEVVFVTPGWVDFYGLNIGGLWYIVFWVMQIVSYLIARGLGAARNAANRAYIGKEADQH